VNRAGRIIKGAAREFASDRSQSADWTNILQGTALARPNKGIIR
jgi:hypothetical protein